MPDPLCPDTRHLAAPDLAYGYWVTVNVPRSARPGTEAIEAAITLDGEKRPTRLLEITRDDSGGCRFDWSAVKRFVDLARACGISRFEWPHLFTQWGVFAESLRDYALLQTMGVDPEPGRPGVDPLEPGRAPEPAS